MRSGKGEDVRVGDAYLSGLLAALSGIKVRQAAQMRAQASLAASAWESAFNAVGLAAAEAFGPIMERLKKSLADIGGDPISEHKLAAMFAATERVIANRVVAAIDDSDGFGWLRRELAGVTAISPRSQTLGRAVLFQRGTTPEVPIPDEKLNRAIALLDEDSLGAYRRKIAKKREKAVRKAARHK